MPYVYGTPYVDGNPINADIIRQNNTNLRAYLNSGIIKGDLDNESVDTPEVIKGEPQFISNEHQFECGNQYNQFIDGEDVNRDYFTGQLKILDASANVLWWVLAETGKVIHIEKEAWILIHAGIEIVSVKNNAMDYDEDGNLDNDGLGSLVQLRIDGVRYPLTEMYTFEETASATGPSQTDNAKVKRRWYPISFLTAKLDPGLHEFVFVIDPVVDKGYVSARNITFEAFYV